MTTAVFTSLDGGDSLAQVVTTLLQSLEYAAPGTDVQLMCFAFTDDGIADELLALLRRRPDITVRIIADWSQSAASSPTVLHRLVAAGAANLQVRFKIDLPYDWNAERGRLVYSYARSAGMMHHKTLCLRRDGVPFLLMAGSFNWSARGRQAYENVIVLDHGADHAPVLAAFDDEFRAMWDDDSLTATPGRARAIFDALRAAASGGVDLDDPYALADALGLPRPDPTARPTVARTLVDGPCIVAFSGGYALCARERAGHATANDRRSLNLLRTGGARRPAPLTLNTLTLEAIRSVPAGATLKVAMYALSNRVPEFQALIDAARSGVRVQLLLDRKINGRGAARLEAMVRDAALPIEVCTTRRRMHQKYLCCPETGMVLTGTANMTMEATLRHADHRILFRHAPALAAAFAEDFDMIRDRVSPRPTPAALAA